MADHILDARGLLCPMPLLKMKQQLNKIPAASTLMVYTTDPGSVRDFQAYLKQSGHELIMFEQNAEQFTFVIKKIEA